MTDTYDKRGFKTRHILLIILLSVGFYYLTIWATPYFVQYKISSKGLIKSNVINFSKKPSPENNRVVPLPNPDFLYSTIGYNLENNILKITGPVPESTYWSIALYQANTTNFFVANDKQLHGQFELYVVKEGSDSPLLKEIPKDKIIYSPTTHGLVLFRYLLSKAYSLDSLTQLQHHVKTEVLVN